MAQNKKARRTLSSKTALKKGEKRKRLIIAAGAALLVFLISGGVYLLTRPRLVWYVDADLTANWNRILRQGNAPFARFEVLPNNGAFPQGRYGFVISRKGPRGSGGEDSPVRVFPNLAATREYEGWFALALDPWMMLRKHVDPEPTRAYIDSPRGRRPAETGLLLLPGGEEDAVRAWLSQLLQERPGVFNQDSAIWDEMAETLPISRNFQDGAVTYTWVQLWPQLFREGLSWIYAPVSRTRAFDAYRQGLLDATRFPEPAGWNLYGLQAEVLWARPEGNEKQRKKLASSEKWLKDSRTQTLIANTIEWIPAHPSGTPYNTVFSEAQIAWMRSAFIWQ
jgi:hypothetical protein